MTKSYEAWHYKIRGNAMPDKSNLEQSPKLLGEYVTLAKAEAAIARRRQEQGFRDWPDGFRIHVVEVDPGSDPESVSAPTRLHALWHFRIGPDDEPDTTDAIQSPVELGVFSSVARADAALRRWRNDPEFQDFPDGFRIFSGNADIDYWAGGFVPFDEA